MFYFPNIQITLLNLITPIINLVITPIKSASPKVRVSRKDYGHWGIESYLHICIFAHLHINLLPLKRLYCHGVNDDEPDTQYG